MPRTGFIDHIGIGVPDLVAAKQYYDELWLFSGSGNGSTPVPEDRSTGPDALGAQAVLLPSRGTANAFAPPPAFTTLRSW